jgi:hypothetical protein
MNQHVVVGDMDKVITVAFDLILHIGRIILITLVDGIIDGPIQALNMDSPAKKHNFSPFKN